MKNSKLIKILRTLSPAEFRDFGLFIRAQYFNQSERLVKLFDFLKKFYPEFDSKEINKETIFALVYFDESHVTNKENKFRDLLRMFVSLLKKYLAQLEFRRRTFENQFYLAKQFSERGLDDLFEYEMGELERFIEKTAPRDEDYYLKKYFAGKLKREYQDSKTQSGKMRPVYESLLEENENIFTFSIINFLLNYLKLRDGEGVVLIEHNKQYENLINYIGIAHESFSDVPAVQILYKFLKLPENGSIDSYNGLLTHFENESHVFKQDDKRWLYNMLYNHCKDKQSKGDREFGREAFDILKKMNDSGFILESDGFMHPHNYINSASTAMRAGELDWAENFIEENKNKIRDEFRENAYNYNMASLEYKRGRLNTPDSKKHFNTALRHLWRVKKEDFYYYARIKNLEVRIYYELNETEQCRYILDSYRKSIDKGELIPENLRERYSEFIRLTHKLILLKDKAKDFTAQELEMEKHVFCLEINSSPAEYKYWLKEKAEEQK
jgi:hypothetical protein